MIQPPFTPKLYAKKKWRLYIGDVDISMHDGIDGEGGERAQAGLVDDVLAVGDDGGEGDVEAVGHLFINKSLHDEREHLDLAVAEHGLLVVGLSSFSGGMARLSGRMGSVTSVMGSVMHGGPGRQVAATAVSALLKLQDGAHELLLALAHAEALEAAEVGLRVAAGGEDERLSQAFEEVGLVFEHDGLCHKVVDKLSVVGLLQLVEGSEGLDLHHWHHSLKQLPQAHHGQRVGFYDGYGVHSFTADMSTRLLTMA